MEIQARIEHLKGERNAIILAHNYEIGEVQDIADFVDDSLALSVAASETDADVIVFCGVDFMAESAKILSPKKTVLHPEIEAKCPMAAMCTAKMIREARKAHPDAQVVGYVNTTAECKAEMDICCTSANAVKVVQSLEADEVIFVPDRNLGQYVQRFTEKRIILWPGFCPTHQAITAAEVNELKRLHPNALFLAHPECRPDVIDIADFVGSTHGMVRFVGETTASEIIVGTEKDMTHRLRKQAPEKKYYWLPNAVCPTMKMITLESIVRSLELMIYEVDIDPQVIEKASVPLQRMTEVGR